jgi:hypothetical protein
LIRARKTPLVSPGLVEEVLQQAQMEIDLEVLPLPLEVGLVDGDRPRVRRAGLHRRLQLDLLGGVVREQQDEVVELVGQHLEALVAAGGEGELAPLVRRRREETVAAMPHEHRPHRAAVDRRQEVEGPGVELEPERVALQRQPLHRHRPPVRPRRAQGGVGGVRGRCAVGGEGREHQEEGEARSAAREPPAHKESLR